MNAFRDDQTFIDQAENLRIFALCECNQVDCGSFWTMEPIAEDDSVELNVQGFRIPHHAAIITIEIYEGQIGFVEILASDYGREIRRQITDALMP